MKNLKTKLNQARRSDGFTIIEVMIVLAIAGVILLIVLLAVPALQRNSRNTAMKADGNAAAAAVSEYESNNGGALPKAISGGSGDWKICDASPCTTAVSDFKTQGSTTVHIEAAVATPTPANYALGHVDIDTGMSCNAPTGSAVTASARATAILYTIETGTTGTNQVQCVSS